MHLDSQNQQVSWSLYNNSFINLSFLKLVSEPNQLNTVQCSQIRDFGRADLSFRPKHAVQYIKGCWIRALQEGDSYQESRCKSFGVGEGRTLAVKPRRSLTTVSSIHRDQRKQGHAASLRADPQRPRYQAETDCSAAVTNPQSRRPVLRQKAVSSWGDKFIQTRDR